MKNLKFKKIILLILAISLIIFFAIGLDTSLEITNYTIYSDKIKNKVRIAFVADTHSCDYGEGQKELLEPLYSSNPDIVFLGGDIIDDKLPFEKGFETIQNLSKDYPTYYVSGNHEVWSKKLDFIKEKVKSFDIQVLDGYFDTITINKEQIDILGIDDPDIGFKKYDEQYQKIKAFKSENLSLLLAHRPERVSEYENLDIDIVFCGHAHGGQWRIPLILKGFFSPNQGFFPKYTGGIYDLNNDIKMVLSRGLSRESTRIPRFYNKPELVIIDILPKN